MGMFKRSSRRLLAVAEHQGCEQSGGVGAIIGEFVPPLRHDEIY